MPRRLVDIMQCIHEWKRLEGFESWSHAKLLTLFTRKRVQLLYCPHCGGKLVEFKAMNCSQIRVILSVVLNYLDHHEEFPLGFWGKRDR